MRAATPHDCPHCRCVWDTIDDLGVINKEAEFYPLVELVANTRAVTCADTPSGAGAASTARPPAKHNGGA